MARKREGVTPEGRSEGNSNTRETENKRGNESGGSQGREEGTEGKDIKQDIESNVVEIPSPKPREVKKREYTKRKTKAGAVGSEQISALLDGIFNVVSLKGGQHWKLNEGESEQISIPLSNILEKMNLLERVTNISDGLALIIATSSIVIPRALITIQIEKNKQPNKEVKKVESRPIENGNNNKPNSNVETGDKKEQSNSLLDDNSLY